MIKYCVNNFRQKMKVHEKSRLYKWFGERSNLITPAGINHLSERARKSVRGDDRPKILFFGTCQVGSMCWALNRTSLAERYQIMQVGVNFIYSEGQISRIEQDLNEIKNSMGDEDILIFTPVYNNELLTIKSLKRRFRGNRSIMVPYIVNTGIFPLYETRTGWKGAKAKLIERNEAKDIIKGTYNFDMTARFKQSLSILYDRENEEEHLEWGLTRYIEENLKYKRLFRTYNHPEWYLIRYICIKIGEYVGVNLSSELDQECCEYDIMNRSKIENYWGLVNECITPYIKNNDWKWVDDELTPDWKMLYACILRYMIVN